MQKTGGSLFLHEWLHVQNKNCSSHEFPAYSLISVGCSCIDDFYTPFAETPDPVIQPTIGLKTAFFAIPDLSIPFSPEIFHSLRGPPASAC